MVVDWQNWDVFYEGKPRDSSENRLEPGGFFGRLLERLHPGRQRSLYSRRLTVGCEPVLPRHLAQLLGRGAQALGAEDVGNTFYVVFVADEAPGENSVSLGVDDFDEVAGALQADVGLVSHFGK